MRCRIKKAVFESDSTAQRHLSQNWSMQVGQVTSSQFRYRPKIEKIGPLRCRWTTSFGVRPAKELCGLKPLYSSLNNWIFSFASSSERNQLTFKHSSRKLPLKDSMNGLSVGFPGREKS